MLMLFGEMGSIIQNSYRLTPYDKQQTYVAFDGNNGSIIDLPFNVVKKHILTCAEQGKVVCDFSDEMLPVLKKQYAESQRPATTLNVSTSRPVVA